MLIRFLYLDRATLEQYVTALEGGSLGEATRRTSTERSGEAGADAKVLRGSRSRTSADEESQTLTDTDEARFSRLLKAAADDPERLGWIDVGDPDTDLEEVGIGAMISWECEIYVPDIVKMLSPAGGAAEAIDMMRSLSPLARTLGMDLKGIPKETELGAMSTFLGKVSTKALVVGEDDATEWRVAGYLGGVDELDEFEGRVRLVGKVARVLREGQWKPFMTFPGMDLMGREARRKAERTPPAEGKEDQYLRGPALMLDVLAVYR